MKLIALIRDGNGRLHLDVTRAPDLLRREISHGTGDAQLCWCGVPPEGVAARAVVAEIESRLHPFVERPGLLIADRAPLRGVTEGGPPRISGLAGLVSVRGLPAG